MENAGGLAAEAVFKGTNNTMDSAALLSTASELVETYGQNARFHVAERMDQAMAAGDGQAYDEWAMIAKAVVLMSMPRAEAPAKVKPATVLPLGRTRAA